MLFPAYKTASLKTKFQAYYRTRRLITVFTKADYWSLYWDRWIQSTLSHPKSSRSIPIPPSQLPPANPGSGNRGLR